MRVNRSCAAPKRSPRSCGESAASLSRECMGKRRPPPWRRMSCAKEVCIHRITSARKFRFWAQTRIGIRAANISSRKAMRATGRSRFFHPEHALILNIEEEHLDFYADLAAIEKVFAQLIDQTSRNGFFTMPTTRMPRGYAARGKRAISFGFAAEADYRGTDIELRDFASVFCVYRRGEQLGEAVLNVPGRHNVSNRSGSSRWPRSLEFRSRKSPLRCAISSTPAGVSKSSTRAIAFCWWTITRITPPRFARRLATAKSIGRKRVLTMFQPHRYSRTKALRQRIWARFR